MNSLRSVPFSFYIIAAFLPVAIIVVIAPGLEPHGKQMLISAGLVLGAGMTWLSALARSRDAAPPRARSWFILSLAALAGLVGNSWSFIVLANQWPSELLGYVDPLLLIALVVASYGLFSFSKRSDKPQLLRLILDGIVVAGSLLFSVAILIFPEVMVGASRTSLPQRFQLIALPTFDVVIATIAALLVARSSRQNRVPLVLFGLGFFSYFISDLFYALQRANDQVGLGRLTNLGWIVGYAFFTLAGRHPDSGRAGSRESQRSSPVVASIVLFGFFLGATAVLIYKATEGPVPLSVSLIWLASSLAALGRQVLLMTDNETLRRDLELKVRERTRDLERISGQRELLLSSVGDGIYGVNQRLQITFVNTAAEQLLRRCGHELIGADAHDLFHLPQPGREFSKQACYVSEAISTGLTTAAESDLYLRGDGTHIPVEVTASPLQDLDGIKGAVVVFRDVTERHEVDRMKGEFVSVVSHELRTPLTSIRGSLGLVSAGVFGPIPTEAGRMINIAVKGTDRLTRLINDILDLERIEADAPPAVETPVSARGLCEEAIISVAGLATEAGVDVGLGECHGRVLASRDRIIQTLVNLLGNAIKFSDPGTLVLVQARLVSEDGPDNSAGSMVEFAVTDHGRGIPPDKLAVIFDRFRQVDSSDAREKGGSGLGLAISQSIVQRYGGRMWVDSELGVGSTFRFTLPGVSDQDDSAGKQDDPTQPTSVAE